MGGACLKYLGSRIADNWVLTAAHCVCDKTGKLLDVVSMKYSSVKLGSCPKPKPDGPTYENLNIHQCTSILCMIVHFVAFV